MTSKDTFLDLEEIVAENKRQESNRLDIFNCVLQQIHALIKRKNKNRIKCMNFKLPLMMTGRPAYDINIMRNYVMHHLQENGFLIHLLEDNLTIYISWDEADINFEKFRKKKEMISQEFKELYLVDNGGGGNDQHELVGMALMEERHNIQKKLKEARNNRLNNSRFGKIPMDYKEFLQKY